MFLNRHTVMLLWWFCDGFLYANFLLYIINIYNFLKPCDVCDGFPMPPLKF